MDRRKFLMLIILSLFTISIAAGAVSANSSFEEASDNNTLTSLCDESLNIDSVDETSNSDSDYNGYDDFESDNSEDEEYTNDTQEYDGEFVVENITQKYDCWGGEINVWLQDNDENPLILGDDVITLYWSDGTKSVLLDADMVNLEDISYDLGYSYVHPDAYYYWLNDDDYDWEGYFDYVKKPIGTYTVTAVCNDYEYNIKPVTFTVKITKGTVKLTPKVYHSASGDYAILKCKVLDSYGQEVNEGSVTFKINGKSYKVNVRYGEAVKKVKLSKAKTYKYTATFNAKNYNSKSASSKVYVYKTSKKARTFKIGKYKVVIPLKKYKKLINAKNTNKLIDYRFYTGKKITQKVKINGKWKTKKKVKVYFNICYGGKTGGQCGVANKYSIYTDTNYQNPGYDGCKPWLSGYKSRALISSF